MAASDHLSKDQFFHGRINVGSLQSDQGWVNPSGVAHYAKHGVAKPIEAVHSGDPKVHIMDGNHRVAGAVARGEADVPAVVISQAGAGTPPGFTGQEITLKEYRNITMPGVF